VGPANTSQPWHLASISSSSSALPSHQKSLDVVVVAPLQGFGQFSCQKNTNGIFIIARVTENFGGGCSPACPCPCPCPCPSCCVPVPLRCARRPHCVQAYRDSTSWNMSLTLSAFPFISLFIVFSGNRPPSTPHMPFRTCRSFSGHNA
jgi:hypothetical protein